MADKKVPEQTEDKSPLIDPKTGKKESDVDLHLNTGGSTLQTSEEEQEDKSRDTPDDKMDVVI